MATPRKFSEKIALHNQRQAEETAEFERIMREVSNATSNVASNASSPSHQHLTINQSLRSSRATSLPNVNDTPPIPIDTRLMNQNLIDMNHCQDQQMHYHERPRGSVGPMRSRPVEKRIDTSPYSGAYLSPPLDSGWRRTHSDSSLHTSSLEPNSQRMARSDFSSMNDGYQSPRRNLSTSPDGRPRSSSSDVPRVPGVNVYPTQPSSAIQIPIGNNTGSLPDLSTFPFSSPLNTPLDYDDQNSQFTNRSLGCESPRSPSPTIINRVARFSFKSTPPHEAPGPPYHLPYANMNQQPSYHQPYVNNQTLQQPLSPGNMHSSYGCPSPHMSPQSPSSPGIPVNHNNMTDQHSYVLSQAQANTLQHHFEQFSVSEDNCTQVRSQEVTPDTGYYSNSPSHILSYGGRQPSTQTTPNTPSSIPDIIITNSFNSDETSDLGAAMAAGSLDLFPSDECLREGLDPIDFDGLQLLRDPDMIADPDTEDHLRLDGL